RDPYSEESKSHEREYGERQAFTFIVVRHLARMVQERVGLWLCRLYYQPAGGRSSSSIARSRPRTAFSIHAAGWAPVLGLRLSRNTWRSLAAPPRMPQHGAQRGGNAAPSCSLSVVVLDRAAGDPPARVAGRQRRRIRAIRRVARRDVGVVVGAGVDDYG